MEFSEKDIPRVAALHDLSCFGRCALTVVIPALSAAGVQVIPVPTALLSTHTGGFNNYYFLDLDSSIGAVGRHLFDIGVELDAIYSGYLGSAKQVETVFNFIDANKGTDTLLFVDPVMGDDGKLYSACTHELVDKMRELCASADIITPNLTEACLLTDTEYPDLSESYADEAARYIADIAEKISEFTNAVCVITGIHFKEGVGTYCKGEMHTESSRKSDYPGTGDLFASVMLAYIFKAVKYRNGFDEEFIKEAAAYASHYTAQVIDYSLEHGALEPRRDGVLLEGCLGKLCRDLCEGGAL